MRWLITGGSGLLGQHARRAIPQGDVQVGWYLRTPFEGGVKVDIRNAAAVEEEISDGFDVCIHCAANPDIASCERDPAAARDLNVDGTRNIAQACEKWGVRLVHVSTDYVFDGASDVPYVEESARNPLQTYGQTKADAEDEARTLDNSLVVRIPLLYGQATPDSRQTWLEQCIESLRAGKKVIADDREVRQPAAAADIARVLVELARTRETGVVHVAPAQALTKFAWSQLIARSVRIDPDLVSPAYEVPDGPRRPLRSTLATPRLEALGIQPPPAVSEMLEPSK